MAKASNTNTVNSFDSRNTSGLMHSYRNPSAVIFNNRATGDATPAHTGCRQREALVAGSVGVRARRSTPSRGGYERLTSPLRCRPDGGARPQRLAEGSVTGHGRELDLIASTGVPAKEDMVVRGLAWARRSVGDNESD